MDPAYNPSYTPQTANWLGSFVNGTAPAPAPAPYPILHPAPFIQPFPCETVVRISRRPITRPQPNHFHPYSMAGRPGHLPLSTSTATLAGRRAARRPELFQVPISVGNVVAGPSTNDLANSSFQSVPAFRYQPNLSSTNGVSSSTGFSPPSGLDATMHRLEIGQSPHNSTWVPSSRPPSQHSGRSSSGFGRSASWTTYANDSGQSSAPSSRAPSRLGHRPSQNFPHYAGESSMQPPPPFAPLQTRPPSFNFFDLFDEPTHDDSSQAVPSLMSTWQADHPWNYLSSSSSGPSQVQGASIPGASKVPNAEEGHPSQPSLASEQAWWSREEFAEAHSRTIRCRLITGSMVRGLLDESGAALSVDPAIQCEEVCNDPAAFVKHLESTHGVINAKHNANGACVCAWAGCGATMTGGSYHRHVVEKHGMHWRCPYKECTQRKVRGTGRKTGESLRSYARLEFLVEHINGHHSGDDLKVMKRACGRRWKYAYAVLNAVASEDS